MMEWYHGEPKEDELNLWSEALVTTSDGFLKIATWNGERWFLDTKWCESRKVIAWMPLPEPYRKDG